MEGLRPRRAVDREAAGAEARVTQGRLAALPPRAVGISIVVVAGVGATAAAVSGARKRRNGFDTQ